jgi:hypothetical protein
VADDGYILSDGLLAVRALQAGDVAQVVADLRACDRLDIAGMSELPPAETLEWSVSVSSQAYALEQDGRCIAVGGVQEATGGAFVWMIGTRGFDRVVRAGAWRLMQPWINHLLAPYPTVAAALPAANRQNRRWLEWLGFRPARQLANYRGLGVDCVLMVRPRASVTSRPKMQA